MHHHTHHNLRQRDSHHGNRRERRTWRAADVVYGTVYTVICTAAVLALSSLIAVFVLAATADAQGNEDDGANYNADGMAEPEEGFDSDTGNVTEPDEQQDQPSNDDGSNPEDDSDDVGNGDSQGDEGVGNDDTEGQENGDDAGLTRQEALEIVDDLGFQAPEECEAARNTPSPGGAVDQDEPAEDDITDECLAALEEIQDEEPEDSGDVDNNLDGAPQADGDADGQDPGAAPEDDGDDDGGLISWVTNAFESVLRQIYDWTIGWMVQWNAEAMRESYLPLPDVYGEAETLYSGLVETVRPALLVGTLVLALLMMLRTTHYDLTYATLTGLPKLLGIGMLLAFLPEFMQALVDLSNGVSEAFFPSEYQIDEAGFSLYQAALSNLAVTNILNVLLLLGLAWVGFLVVVASLLTNIFFIVLFITAPFALIASLVPGLSALAVSWFKAVLALAAIPTLWSIQVGVGAFIVRNPEAIFGGYVDAAPLSGGVSVGIGAILILWIMWKTPFKVLEWAFASYSPSGGIVRTLGKTAMFAAAGMATRAAVGAAVGKGAGSGGPNGGGPGGGKEGVGPGGAGKPKPTQMDMLGGGGGKKSKNQDELQSWDLGDYSGSQGSKEVPFNLKRYLKDTDPHNND